MKVSETAFQGEEGKAQDVMDVEKETEELLGYSKSLQHLISCFCSA